MDSFTQAVLGGAVGQAVLGREEGKKAILWGVVAGTLPDLDILIYPFVDDVQALAIHRGLSHSFFFAALSSPFLGLGLSKLYPKSNTSWKRWALLVFLGFTTHALLDAFTHYGTQLFYPFSNHPVSFDAVSIIDVFYTLPLALGLVVALVSRKRPAFGQQANRWGLAISTGYILLTLLNKSYVSRQFTASLNDQGIQYERIFTNPAIFSNFLWYSVVETDSTFLFGTYSLFDNDRNITYQPEIKNEALLAPYAGDPPIQRIEWFSKGYYSVHQIQDTLVVNDVRFPRTDLWLDTSGAFLFSFELERTDGVVTGFRQRPLAVPVNKTLWSRYRKRVFGNKALEIFFPGCLKMLGK